jgi:hypothetical protein
VVSHTQKYLLLQKARQCQHADTDPVVLRMRKAMAAWGWSQDRFARCIGTYQPTLSDFMHGKLPAGSQKHWREAVEAFLERKKFPEEEEGSQ